MRFVEVKSATPNRAVNIKNTTYEFGLDCISLIPEDVVGELKSNPNYSLTGNTYDYDTTEGENQIEESPVVTSEISDEIEIKKVIEDNLDTKKVIEDTLDVKKVIGNKKPNKRA